MAGELQEPLRCEHCGTTELKHQGEPSYGHAGLCCDCFDLSCGMSLAQLNEERAEKGLPPLQPMKRVST